MLKEFFSSVTGKSMIVVLIAFAFLFFVFYFKRDENIFSTRALTFSAILLALGIATNQVTVFSLPQGGSVTLFSMFFVVYIGYMFGLRVGLVSAISYGLLNLLIKPSVYHPIQLIFDYILAFGALGLSGIFVCKDKTLTFAYSVAIVGRYIFSVISGYVFFGSYAPEGWNPIFYSIWYNFSYIGVEGIITIFLISLPIVRDFFEKLKYTNYKTK